MTSGRNRDDRGQATWIGAMFLLFLAISSLTIVQTAVVPDQNEAVEADHYQAVQEDMSRLRSGVATAGQRNDVVPVAVDLGPEYPPRLFTLNPAEPAGSLRTSTVGDVRVVADGTHLDLSTLCDYGTDPVETRSIVFEPNYNYLNAGRLAYDSTVLYQGAGVAQVEAGQFLVQGEHVRLFPLAGNLSVSSTRTVTVELVGDGGGVQNVSVTNDLTVGFPSRLPASEWRDLLSSQSAVVGVEQAASDRIRVTLEGNRTYTVECQPVGLNRTPPLAST